MSSSLSFLIRQKRVVCRTFFRTLTTKPSRTSKHVLDEMFSADERARILDCFNRCSAEELQFTKQLSHQKALAVVKYRERNGNFGALAEILRVPGVGILGLQKLCSTMKSLDYTDVQKLREKLDMETVKPSPPLPEPLRQNLSSLVALDLHADCVTFAHMSRDLTLQSWDVLPLFDKPFQRVDHVLFLDRLLQAVERLPQAECYVFESKIYRYTSLRVIPFLTNLRILEAMLVTLLNAEQVRTTQKYRSFFLKPHSVMRFFQLSVGGERVSGQHMVRELQRNFVLDDGEGEASASPMGGVTIPRRQWEHFLAQQSLGHEHLTNSLLLAVAFYKLVVLRTHSLQF